MKARWQYQTKNHVDIKNTSKAPIEVLLKLLPKSVRDGYVHQLLHGPNRAVGVTLQHLYWMCGNSDPKKK